MKIKNFHVTVLEQCGRTETNILQHDPKCWHAKRCPICNQYHPNNYFFNLHLLTLLLPFLSD